MQSPFPLHLVLPHSASVYPILVPNVAYALPKFGLHAGGALLHCTPLALFGYKGCFHHLSHESDYRRRNSPTAKSLQSSRPLEMNTGWMQACRSAPATTWKVFLVTVCLFAYCRVPFFWRSLGICRRLGPEIADEHHGIKTVSPSGPLDNTCMCLCRLGCIMR